MEASRRADVVARFLSPSLSLPVDFSTWHQREGYTSGWSVFPAKRRRPSLVVVYSRARIREFSRESRITPSRRLSRRPERTSEYLMTWSNQFRVLRSDCIPECRIHIVKFVPKRSALLPSESSIARRHEGRTWKSVDFTPGTILGWIRRQVSSGNFYLVENSRSCRLHF